MPDNDNSLTRELPHPLWLSLPRLTSAFLQSAFVIISLPIIVLAFAPEEHKGLLLGLLSGASVVLTVLVLLSVACWSDRLPGRRARRTPFVLLGHALVLPAAVLTVFGGNFVLLVLAVYLAVAARSAIDAAHLPMLNDMVPERQRGRYSTPISVMQVVGAAGGAVLAGYLAQIVERAQNPSAFLLPLALVSLALAAALAAIFHSKVIEPARKSSPAGMLRALLGRFGRRERAYLRFMLARTVFLVGIFAVIVFFVYLIRDVYQAPDFKRLSAFFYAAAALGAALAAIPAGRLSDRFGCLPVIYASGALEVVACALVFAFGPASHTLAYIGSFLFGAGFGAMFASSLALSTKLIPSHGDAAKFMALLVVSTYAAQLIAALTAGPLLDWFNSLGPLTGYAAIFELATICFVGGAAILWNLPEPKGGSEESESALPAPHNK